MIPWVNKVIVVTSCEDKLGLTVMELLAKSGMTVIGFAKTEFIVNKITEKLKICTPNDLNGKIVLCKCDIANLKQLKSAFAKIIETYGGVDVLVNNAHCNIDCSACTGELCDFKKVIDININALIVCIRLAAGNMIERQSRGHIININNLCAYQLPEDSRKNVFIATKAAAKSINEILRHEFRYLKANVKVTNVVCGNIESEEKYDFDEDNLKLKDVAKLVKLILNTPEHVQVHEILLDSCE
ncbi:dehydrogenase/reductase SDR family member 11-like [Hyposmocoma kahamanoa]|uniref:dehydrogenase/reductase SDR family member 11-like n=1 Tax=Hyposmocoma kahamanoa TaxID=1477025 RepID=UPI000E6D67C2|nr:dehydrogenase/reductase SDR family member 11-like [Hyposmocoma kahamanoa]